MPNENIWLAIQSLAAALDGSREESEQVVDDLERDFRNLPESQHRLMDEDMTVVIAQLSRLKMRLRVSTQQNRNQLEHLESKSRLEFSLVKNIHGVAKVAGLDGDEVGYLPPTNAATVGGYLRPHSPIRVNPRSSVVKLHQPLPPRFQEFP